MIKRLLAIGFVLLTASACITPGSFRTSRVIPPSVSPPISTADLQLCKDAACLLNLAKAQNTQTHEFEGKIAKVAFAATHILLEEEAEALAIVDSIDGKGFKDLFYKNFGSIDKDKVNKFIADTQRWENIDLPLPESLLGRNEEYDTLYAFFLAINGEAERAFGLSQTLKKKANRYKILYILALHALKDNDFEGALKFARELGGNIKSATSRSRALSLIYYQYYKEGFQAEALQQIEEMSYLFDKDGARAGIALAMAQEGIYEPAIQLSQKILSQKMRLLAYEGILSALAVNGELEFVRQVIAETNETDRSALSYPRIISAFAKSGHLDLAEDLLRNAPDDTQTIYSLSQLGKVTGDITYFQQALVLAKELQSREDTKLMKGTLALSIDMAQAGYLEESIKTLHLYKPPLIRKITRDLIFSSLHKSPRVPKDYNPILDMAEQDLNGSRPEEYNQILKNATKLMLVNRADLDGINRYLKLVDRVENPFNRQSLYGRVIPHLAYLGEFDRVYTMISSMTHTMPRIYAILRLAEFHILKKKINTI